MKKNTTLLKLFLFIGTNFIIYTPNACAEKSFLEKRKAQRKAIEEAFKNLPTFAIAYLKNDYHLVGENYQPSEKFNNEKDKNTYTNLINKYKSSSHLWGFYPSNDSENDTQTEQVNFRFVYGIEKKNRQRKPEAILIAEGTISTKNADTFREAMFAVKPGPKGFPESAILNYENPKLALENFFKNISDLEATVIKIDVPESSKK